VRPTKENVAGTIESDLQPRNITILSLSLCMEAYHKDGYELALDNDELPHRGRKKTGTGRVSCIDWRWGNEKGAERTGKFPPWGGRCRLRE